MAPEETDDKFVVIDGEVTNLPAWSICPDCEGEGKHDPDAFAGGFSGEDFAEDKDFREAYFGGAYDVKCSRCDGSGKVHVDRDPGRTRARTRCGLAINEAGEPLETRGW